MAADTLPMQEANALSDMVLAYLSITLGLQHNNG